MKVRMVWKLVLAALLFRKLEESVVEEDYARLAG
jgi:hypothetical protein